MTDAEREMQALIDALRGASPSASCIEVVRAGLGTKLATRVPGPGGAIDTSTSSGASSGALSSTTVTKLGVEGLVAIALVVLGAGLFSALPGDGKRKADEGEGIADHGSRTMDRGPRIEDRGSRIEDHGSRIMDREPPATDPGPRTMTLGPRSSNLEPRTPEPRASDLRSRVSERVARSAQAREAPPRVEVDAVEAPARAPESVPPSEALARGLSAYPREAYLDAATAFREVLEGRTDDSPSSVEKARFFLAKSLFHLGFHHGALTVFDEITRGGREHAYFVESLPWIARLADALELDRDPLLLEIVGRYSRADLASLDTPETRASFDHLLFLLGRARYENRKLGEAVALFRRIRPGSKHHVPARFFEGVSQVRMRRARPAVAAFRSAIDAIDRGEHGGVDDPERMRDLAWLSLGRMYYTAANREDDAGRYRVDGRVLGAAIDAWERIDQGSEHWLDALFEASWAFYLVGDYERALGRIHALESPFFRDAFYPEALVIRAVAHYSLCQLDATEAVLAEFRRRFDPLHAALVRVRRAHGDATSANALLDAVHARGTRSSLSPPVARLLRRVLGDRELLSESALVDAIAREEASVARLNDPSHEPLLAWLGQELAVQRALADDHVGELVLARVDRLLDELRDRQNEIDAIDLEVATMRRTSPPSATGRGDDVSIVADQEHMVWPFDGEYWRDELPYYRVRVQNRCAR